MELITSLQNPKVKLAYNLQERARMRRKERKIVLEGVRLIGDALERKHKPLYVLYEPNSADPAFIQQLTERGYTMIGVNSTVINHVSDTQNPQGVVAVFPLPVPPLPRNVRRVLILDNLRDPGNLGTILRTAAAAGVQVVLLSPGSTDPYNPKALRSGMGAHFRIPVVEAEWQQIAEYCDPLTVYMAAGGGERRYDQVDWREPWALIIGSEAHGVDQADMVLEGEPISIPMFRQTESLNAAVAAGVILFEATRQINFS